MSISNYSFEQWCIDNNRQDILERWDYNKNDCAPSDIGYMSNRCFYFKCPKGQHESRLYKICDLHKSKYPLIKCLECGSFAQYITLQYGEEFFNKIWNKNNSLNPWKIQYKSNKDGIFNCLDNSSHVYNMSFEKYTSGIRCPYCSHHRINEENSLGSSNPEVLQLWSDKNEKTPYEFAPHSSELVWWKCNCGIHKDYQRSIAHSNTQNFICPECGKMQGYINRKENITGQIFGELKALYIDEEKTHNEKRTYWVCQCSCGEIRSVDITNLKSGNSTTCGNRTIHYSKEKNGNWQGGLTSPLRVERTSQKYNTWRDSVYKKDWYTCQCCGKSKNIYKNAHHILNFLDNEELRYDIKNGILLCDECHAFKNPNSFHYMFGTRNNTPEQLEEYINKRRKELNIDKPFKMVDYLNGDILKPNMV